MATSIILSKITVNIQSFHMFVEAIQSMRVGDGLPSLYNARNSCAQGLGLPPSAISQGRIVGGRRGQVPLCVCSIQSGTMPVLKLAEL